VRHVRILEGTNDVDEGLPLRQVTEQLPFASPATSTYCTSAGTTFFGLKIAASASRRPSGTLTVARFG